MLKLTALALAALHGAALAAPPVAVSPYLPPPGLYRMDVDANSLHQGGTTIAAQQPATGAVTMRAQKPGSAPTTRAYPNPGPQEICIGARTPAGFNPMALAGKSNCTSSSVVPGPGGATFTGKCEVMDYTSVVRKLNAATWEINTTATMHMGSQGMLDFDQQRKLVQLSLKNATTAEERAEAQYTLDHWEAYKAEVRQSAAEAGAAGAPGAITQTTSVVTRLTRLGDCKVASARQ
jgi:hypothetical protein